MEQITLLVLLYFLEFDISAFDVVLEKEHLIHQTVVCDGRMVLINLMNSNQELRVVRNRHACHISWSF